LGRLNYIEVRVPWYREKDYFSNAPWHGVAEVSGGGTLLTQGSHGLDLALWFSGSAPVSAFGSTYQRTFTSTRVEDLAFGVVETQSGVPILISSAMVARPGHPMTVAVYGKAGSAVFTASSPPRLRYRDVRRGVRVPSTPLQPYRSSLAAFRDWIEGGRPYRCSGRDAVPVLSAVDGIYRSARSGQRVDIAVPAG
jgi:predicted dehydrogenase